MIRLGLALTAAAWLLVLGVLGVRAALSAGPMLAYNVWLDRNLEIYLLDINHRLSAAVTRGHNAANRPVWSPDGQSIAFEGRQRGGSAIFILTVRDQQVRQLLPDHPVSQYTPVWFADSSGLYFRDVPGEEARAFKVKLDGSDLQPVQITNYDLLIPPRFDPNRRIVIGSKSGGGSGIFLASGYRANLEQHLVTTDVQFREQPQWSPDNQQIAFISWGDRSEVYLMNADGSDFRQVTDDGLLKGNLSWRPGNGR